MEEGADNLTPVVVSVVFDGTMIVVCTVQV